MQYFGQMTRFGTTDRTRAALLVAEPGQAAGSVYLAVEGRTHPQPITIAAATAPIGNSNWRLTLSTGDIMHLPHDAVDDALRTLLPLSSQRSAKLGMLENIRWRGLVLLVVLMIGLGYGFRQSIAPLGDLATKAVSLELTDRISTLTLAQLDATPLFEESQLSAEQKAEITASFATLLAHIPEEFRNTRLHFRHAPSLGPNAFALAGNDVVLLDDMIAFTDDADILLAVLAHELGHVINRHAARQIMRSVVFTIGVSVAIGAEDSIVEEMASLGGSFILAKYARESELEADQVSADMLEKTGRDPHALEAFFRQLQAECGDKCDGGGYLASHPSFDSRIDALAN